MTGRQTAADQPRLAVLIIVAYQRSPCERAENSAGGVKEWRLWTRSLDRELGVMR